MKFIDNLCLTLEFIIHNKYCFNVDVHFQQDELKDLIERENGH